MLPPEQYRKWTYPPPGNRWLQFGDKQLNQAIDSISKEAHDAMTARRESMREVHEKYLEKNNYFPVNTQQNGTAPMTRPAPVSQPSAQHFSIADPEEDAQHQSVDEGSQTRQKQLVYERGVAVSDAPVRKQLVAQRGVVVSDAPVKKNLVYQRQVAAETGAPSGKKKLESQRGMIASYIPPTGVDAHTQATMATAMDDDAATVDYGDDDRNTVNYGSDIEVDDAEMTRRVDKRKTPATEQEDKKKPKVKPEIKPVIQTEVQTGTPIKQEGVVKPVKKDNKILKKKRDDEEELQMTGVNINRSQDMAFWEEQSARELRTQLNLRYPGKVGDWAFKTRLQLLNIVKDQITRGAW